MVEKLSTRRSGSPIGDTPGAPAGTNVPARLLIQIRNRADRDLVKEWLSESYKLISPDVESALDEPFDLAFIDGPNLKRLRSKIGPRRKEEEPVFLPFLLLTVRRKGWRPTRHLGRLVDDLILRPLHEEELLARVANLLRRRRLSVELKKEHDRVVKLSVTDDVSGFYNTRYLHRYLDRLLASPTAREEEVSLVFFDLDNFKEVVDVHGHLLGSKVLRELAQTVSHVLDEEDRLIRYGGDEYVVILPRQNKDQALGKVERMKEEIASTPFLQKEGLFVRVTASFGLATFPHDARDKKELLGAADRCLFKSKSRGKDRISFAGMPSAVESPLESHEEVLEPL
jgi:diguanylate cyclase (GGDEF)-like protein